MAGLAPLISEMLGMESATIEYLDDGRRHSLQVGDLIDIEIEDFVPPQLSSRRRRGDAHWNVPSGQLHADGRKANRSRCRRSVWQFANEGKNGAQRRPSPGPPDLDLGLDRAAPTLRQVTLPTSVLLLVGAGAWVGVLDVSRGMGPMQGRWACPSARSSHCGRS